MTYVRQEQGLEACPACGSGRLVCVLPQRMGLDGCCECFKFWERLPAGEAYLVDGEQLPFRVPCDNCAFRGKSPERSDEQGWESLMWALANGGEFYCHKAVPFDHRAEANGFEFPLKDGGTTSETGLPRARYDRDRMRACRGWLNQFWSPRSTHEQDLLPRT